MKAKITKEGGYTCCPEGHTAVPFPCGEIVTGKVAEWAVADRAASRMLEKRDTPPENKAEAAPENKAKRRKKG